MTSRERLFAALSGQPVDRTPIWLLFPYHATGYYADVRHTPCYASIFEKSRECCVMLDRRNPGVPLFSPEVEETRETVEQDDWTIDRRKLRCRGRELVAETRRRGSEIRVRKLLETEADLDVLLTFPVNDDPAAVAKALEQQAAGYFRERQEFPEACGAMMLDQSEPISFLYGNSNLEEYAVWSLACPEKVVKFLDRAMQVYRLTYDYTLRHDWAETYFLVGSELASPPLVSRATFQQWIVPYARELIARIHARGRFAIQHYHGQIREILPDFLTMGADALHTIESPPTGNCTLSQAYDIVGDRITLIGNVQYDLFRSLSPADMKAEVRRVLHEVNGRRFILSPTAGPYEPEIPPRMVENYLAFLEAGWEG